MILIILIIIIVLVIFCTFPFIEPFFIYRPSILPKNYNFQIENFNEINNNKDIALEEINIKEQERIINCLYFKNSNSDNLIIFSHGNAGNILNRIPFAVKLANLSSVLIYDYRGYGKSTGKPTEKGLYADIITVWKYTIKNKLVNDPNNIILYGESLGCSVTAHLGSKLCKNKKYKPKSIIMQSGFSSLKNIALDLFPKFLVIFLYSKYDSMKYLAKIKGHVPILILHSNDDEMINVKHAHALIAANNSSTIDFHALEGTHNNPVLNSEYINVINKYIKI